LKDNAKNGAKKEASSASKTAQAESGANKSKSRVPISPRSLRSRKPVSPKAVTAEDSMDDGKIESTFDDSVVICKNPSKDEFWVHEDDITAMENGMQSPPLDAGGKTLTPKAINKVAEIIRSRTNSNSSSDKKFKIGDEITCDFKKKGKLYDGKIAKENPDGTFNLRYNDGDFENNVVADRINLRTSSESKSPKDRSDITLQVGMKVLANYDGQGHWYSGTVVAKHSDDTYDVEYSDGDSEKNVKRSLIQISNDASSVDADAVAQRLTKEDTAEDEQPQPTALVEGAEVLGNHNGKGKWYPGTIAKVHADGTFDLHYEDGDRESKVRESHVRLKAEVLKQTQRGASPKAASTGTNARNNAKNAPTKPLTKKNSFKDDRSIVRRGSFMDGTAASAAKRRPSATGIQAPTPVPTPVDNAERGASSEAAPDVRSKEAVTDHAKRTPVPPASPKRSAKSTRASAHPTKTNEPPVEEVDVATEEDEPLEEEPHKEDFRKVVLGDDGKETFECTLCKMKFRSSAQLERHIKYSEVHGKNIAEYRKKSAEIVREKKLSYLIKSFIQRTSLCAKITVVQMRRWSLAKRRWMKAYKTIIRQLRTDITIGFLMNQFRRDNNIALPHSSAKLIYEGPKFFWRSKDSLVVNLYLHNDGDLVRNSWQKSIIEVVSFDTNEQGELSRLYIDYKAILKYLNGEISKAETSAADDSNKEKLTRRSTVTGHIVDDSTANKIVVEYIVDRLQIESIPSRLLWPTKRVFLDTNRPPAGASEDSATQVVIDTPDSPRDSPRDNLERTSETPKVLEKKGSINGVCPEDLIVSQSEATKSVQPTVVRRLQRRTSEEVNEVIKDLARRNSELGDSISRAAAIGHTLERDTHQLRKFDSQTGEEVKHLLLTLGVNTRVHGNYGGEGKWYPGRISGKHADGTYDILYDDGDNETQVHEDCIKIATPGKPSHAAKPLTPKFSDEFKGVTEAERANENVPKLTVGAEVLGNHNGKGKWYPGTIAKVHADGTFDLHYEDGDRESKVRESHVRIKAKVAEKEKASAPAPVSTTRSIEERDRKEAVKVSEGHPLNIGAKVLCNYRGEGKWYPGTISKKHADGTFSVEYDDGDAEEMLQESLIKLAKEARPTAKAVPATRQAEIVDRAKSKPGTADSASVSAESAKTRGSSGGTKGATAKVDTAGNANGRSQQIRRKYAR
jgi:uncharacterized C2H2 Zn-finger protein